MQNIESVESENIITVYKLSIISRFNQLSIEFEMENKPKTISQYRKHLKIICQDQDANRSKLKNLSDGSIKSGRFKILCVIKEVKSRDFVYGFCRFCKCISPIRNFGNSSNFDCPTPSCNASLQLHIMIKLDVIDEDKFGSTLILKNMELLNCLGLFTPNLKPETLEGTIAKKLDGLRNGICEFGAGKSYKRKPLYIYSSRMK